MLGKMSSCCVIVSASPSLHRAGHAKAPLLCGEAQALLLCWNNKPDFPSSTNPLLPPHPHSALSFPVHSAKYIGLRSPLHFVLFLLSSLLSSAPLPSPCWLRHRLGTRQRILSPCRKAPGGSTRRREQSKLA